jgi:hypothetical protein
MGRGALTFKGEAPKAKKKRKREKHLIAATTAEGDSAAVFVTTNHSEVAQRPISQDAKPQPVQVTVGSGKIITSGTVVTGLGTKFEQELAVGDAMIVVLDGKQEMRVVKMRLSDISCGISSAFSSSLVTPTTFQIIRKPTNSKEEAKQKRDQTQKERDELEQSAFGTFRGTNELVYRERTEHGNYRIQKVGLGVDKTRTELLSMRAKKTSDKYC